MSQQVRILGVGIPKQWAAKIDIKKKTHTHLEDLLCKALMLVHPYSVSPYSNLVEDTETWKS